MRQTFFGGPLLGLHGTGVGSDESHNLYMDLGSIVGSLDILEFMVWELVAGAINPTGYYIENGISKRYCDGVDIICRHLIGYVFIGLLSYSHPM